LPRHKIGEALFCFYIEDLVFWTRSEIEGICLGLIGIRKEKRGKRKEEKG
jgi:hypothetical protein